MSLTIRLKDEHETHQDLAESGNSANGVEPEKLKKESENVKSH
jgi:hypothetical protein